MFIVHRNSAEAHRCGRLGAAGLLLLCGLASARVLIPAWSVPLFAFPRSVSVQTRPEGDWLYVLLADGRLAVVSGRDTLRMLGAAPIGATALAAAPEVKGEPSLYFAATGRIVAADSVGQELWRTKPILPERTDVLWYAGAAGANRVRLCAWTGSAIRVVVVGPETASVSTAGTGFTPAFAHVNATGSAGLPELVAAGSDGILLASFRNNCERRVSRPAGAVGCADIDGDSLYEIAVLTDPSPRGAGFDTVRCLDARSMEERWRAGIGTESMVGHGTALLAGSVRVYVAGVTDDGTGFVTALDELGRRQGTVEFAPGLGRPFDMVSIGGWPMVLLQTSYGPQTARLLPPGLVGSTGESPGYNGVRIQQVVPLRLGPDTFPDVLVLRTAADAPARMDMFNNNLAAVAAELVTQRERVRSAAARHDDAAVMRAERRLRLLEAELNPGVQTTVREEELARARGRRRASRALLWFGLFLLSAAAAAVTLVLVLGRRAGRRGDAGGLIEQMPLSARVALAMDLVAMDHNFVSKGNWPAAIERLREIRQRYGLDRDVDLGRATDVVEPWYSRAVARLVDGTPSENVLELIVTAARRARPDDTVVVEEKTREQFRKDAGQPGFRVVCLRNREYPDIYGRLRIFANARLRGVIEHVTLDHCRYAQRRAAIVLDYSVSTQWNRKLSIRFYSDSREVIDFSRGDGHLVSELTEIATVLRPAAETPGPDWRPTEADDIAACQPHDLKLYVRFSDLISVLDETRARLGQGEQGAKK